ncbi:MAG TPA: hypothetical protein VKZ47_08595 [Acidimicrobiia bacterium]|nr:hypothetical protein [Acidimicrobiia bacterium]
MNSKKLRWTASSLALAGMLVLGACATDDDPGTGTTLPGTGTTLPGTGTTLPDMGTTTVPGTGTSSTSGG